MKRVTSVSVEPVGAHERVWVWVNGQSVGSLTVGKGDGAWLREVLLSGQPATALEFDDTVERLSAVAKAHGWTLKSWGLQRYHSQPATAQPTTPELRPGCTSADYYEPRAAAERAVLDACAALHLVELEYGFHQDSIERIAVAVLALRAVKP